MKIGLVGYGKMGKTIFSKLKDDIVCIVDKEEEGCLKSLFEYNNILDLIIDFSHPKNLEMIYDYASRNKTKVLLGTTGYNSLERDKIYDLATKVSVMMSANYSLGIAIMTRIIASINPLISEKFDIEIVEEHHNKKIDSPSGTAKCLFNTINAKGDYIIKYDRSGQYVRQHKEIGVHSLRGGSINGRHEVLYYADDEILSIKHEALSGEIFAKGAIVAATWLLGRPKGLYSMDDVLFKEEN